ncbi:hypothetical protein QBC39DRAFT_328266 [Podospora conica]|nr:hypothetical protein QBC39DRAFT_328266 [Schizothecium conicum]
MSTTVVIDSNRPCLSAPQCGPLVRSSAPANPLEGPSLRASGDSGADRMKWTSVCTLIDGKEVVDFPAARPVPRTRVAMDDRDLVRDDSTHPESLNRSDWKSVTVESTLGLNAGQTAAAAQVAIHGVARFCDHTDEGGSSPSLRPRKSQYVPSGSSLQTSNNGNIPMQIGSPARRDSTSMAPRQVRSAQPVQAWRCRMLGDAHDGSHATALPPTWIFASSPTGRLDHGTSIFLPESYRRCRSDDSKPSAVTSNVA